MLQAAQLTLLRKARGSCGEGGNGLKLKPVLVVNMNPGDAVPSHDAYSLFAIGSMYCL